MSESRPQFTRETAFGVVPDHAVLDLIGGFSSFGGKIRDLRITIKPPVDESTQGLVNYLIECRNRDEEADLLLPDGYKFHGRVVGQSQEIRPDGIRYEFTLMESHELPPWVDRPQDPDTILG